MSVLAPPAPVSIDSGVDGTLASHRSRRDGAGSSKTTATVDPNIDPSLTNDIRHSIPTSSKTTKSATGDAVSSGSSSSALAADVQDEGNLKRTYLSLLSSEQLVDLLLSFDARTPADATKDLWPEDLKQAVSAAAVAAILGQGAKDKALDALKALGIDAPSDVGDAGTQAPTATNGVEGERSQTSDTPPLVATAPMLGTFHVPPQQTSVFASGTLAYQQSSFVPQFYEPPASSPGAGPSRQPEHSPPPQGIPPPNMPPPPPPPPLGFIPGGPDEDEDLPSYEDMIVQAIVVHNDPIGTAPKQIFQWMASTYPLQTNFRPSASQALQKAFKRGRLEKNPDGRYRLNVAWSGGSTAKRVTRRPQTYNRSVTNPSPSSHQASSVHQYPPHHFAFQYGPGGKSTLSSSPVPPSMPVTVAPPPARAGDAGETNAQVHDAELKDSMEKAINILQALTATPAGPDDTAQPPGKDDQALAKTAEPARPAPAKEKKKAGKAGKKTATAKTVPPPIFAAETSLFTPPPTAATLSEDTNETADADARTRLQGALALLATQLAEVAAESRGAQVHAQAVEGDTSRPMRDMQSDLQAQWAKLLAQDADEVENSSGEDE